MPYGIISWVFYESVERWCNQTCSEWILIEHFKSIYCLTYYSNTLTPAYLQQKIFLLVDSF